MADVDNLMARINAEFSAHQKKVAQFRTDTVEEHKGRTQRLEILEAAFGKLRDVWRPRLEALAAHFKDTVKVTPTITPGNRQANMEFQSPLARIRMRLSVATNSDVTKFIMSYDLDILPILMVFEKHSEIEFPIDKIDEKALGNWLDDRILTFIKTYISLSENQYYLKDHMVDDPVAHVRFPKFAAGATLERDGKTMYFISDETRREFENRDA